jgi:uncharacterized glyoxalase superfamily protein PhnB
MTDWFARPVLHVKNVETSVRFYINQLGFTSPWRYDEDGRVYVAQVDRQGCALILADSWPEKIGKGLMFISLNVEPQTREAAVAALDALRAELEAKGVPVKDGSWGYRLLVVDDLDGNQLFFNYPNETASGRLLERKHDRYLSAGNQLRTYLLNQVRSSSSTSCKRGSGMLLRSS